SLFRTPRAVVCRPFGAGLTLFSRQRMSGASLPLDGRGRPSPREYRYAVHRGLWSAAPSGLGSRYSRGSGCPDVRIVIPDTAGCDLPPLRGWAHSILEAAPERSFAPLDGRARPSPR